MKNKKLIVLLLDDSLYYPFGDIIDGTQWNDSCRTDCYSDHYIFIDGSLIKLYKANDKLKDSLLCFIGLLFWLP